MDRKDINIPRFARSIREALAGLELEARCYSWLDDPEYLEIKRYLEDRLEDLRVVRPLTKREVELLDNEPVTIWHRELGRWLDTAKGVSSFMDMNDLELQSGKWLSMADYENVWVCYKRSEEMDSNETI